MGKNDLNFEINIIPILDILSVMICFLLLTAVWIQVGTLDTRQAVGDNRADASQNPPSVWVTMENDGTLVVSLRDLPSSQARKARLETEIRKTRSGVNWEGLYHFLESLHSQWPELKTGIVLPNPSTPYKDVIRVMDQLKSFNFEGVGLSPLG